MGGKRNRGFTMVSVMVGFLILLMGISALFASLEVSRNMVLTSTARFNKNEGDLEKLYQSPDYQVGASEETGLKDEADNVCFNISGSVDQDQGTGFYYFH
ncbi:MAG: prepilin-type N-terminal cleavage/methylation domain-containing protein [Eubacteriales bacterium]|nr:prepilin-type N-terminal cleavage/methylation domain-containing protein [Eubacteriales bacterium]